MKFRTILLVGVAVVVSAVVVAVVGAVAVVLDQAARREVVADLDRSTGVFEDLQQYRQTLYRSEAHVVAEEPRLKAAVATEDVSRETMLGVANELRRALASDLFLLTDGQGRLLVDVAEPEAQGDDMANNPVIAAALAKGDGEGIWIHNRHGFQVQAHRLMFGATSVGVLVIGYAIDDKVAQTVHLRTGGAVAIRLGHDVIVASPLEGGATANLGELSQQLAGIMPDPTEVTIGGERYLALARTFAGRSDLQYVMMRSLDRALQPGQTLARLIYLIAAIGLAIALIFAVGFARRLSGPIDRLVKFTRTITTGNLEQRAEVGGPIEVRALGDAMNTMAGELERSRQALAKTTRRLEQEMEIASKIQTSILPRMLNVKRLEVAAKMLPATEVGGDYYDILPVEDGCWIGIGDVAGHGVTAGLVMMMMQSVVAAITRHETTAHPKDVICLLNAILYENIRHRLATDSHVTATLLRYTTDGKVVFAGRHEDLIVYRAATKTCEKISTPGIWLGIDRDVRRGTIDTELVLEDGDLLVLYTDGVIEARDAGKREFGDDRLCAEIERHAAEPVDRILDHVITTVQQWAVQQRDDVTMVVLRYRSR